MSISITLHLAKMGKKVTIIEMLGGIASEVFDESRKQLLQLLDEYGVTQMTETRVVEITGEGVIAETKSGKQTIQADTVILALGLRAETNLLDSLRQAGREVIAIGDCVRPRKIIDAIWEGYRRARVI